MRGCFRNRLAVDSPAGEFHLPDNREAESSQRAVPFLPLLVFFVLLGTCYSLSTPLFEAPDEVWHYAYLRYVATTHTFPPLTNDESGAYQEVAQPPLYYTVAAALSGWLPDDDLPDLMWHNPGFGYQAGGTVNDNKNMLIHTERERFPWRGAVLAVRAARFVSLAFGLMTVVATWGAAQEVFPPNSVWVWGTAALVACNPQFLFISGVVSNDSAAAALSTAVLWATARVIRRGVSSRRMLVLGLLTGLAALTKTSLLLLLPLVAVTVALLAHLQGRRRGWTIGNVVGFVAVAVFTGGWWYLRNALRYDDPLATSVHVHTPWGWETPLSVGELLTYLPTLYRSFWGGFGWGHVEFPVWVYLATGVLPVASLAGWWRAWRRRDLPGSGGIFLWCLVWGGLVLLALLQWMRQVYAPHGRLLFPAIGAMALLLAGGWASLSERWATMIRRLSIGGLALLSLITPWWIIRPAFAPPRLLTPTQAAATVSGVSLTYGHVARLMGAVPNRESVTPGGTLTIRACWQALAPMEEDYTVFIHLVGRNDMRVGERYTYPGLGRFPTSLWPVGSAFCDVYRLSVAEWTPVPALYDVVVGLYEANSGERLTAWADGGAVGLPVVAQVRVAPRRPLSLPTDAHPLDYRLGEDEAIALIGYRIGGPVRTGSPLTVTLYWQALASPSGDYTVFVHLTDDSGQPITQHDGPPRYGRYPTGVWHRGDVIPDEHLLNVPAAVSGQRLHVVTGMYHPQTLERLPVVVPTDGEDREILPNRLIPVAEVSVRP